MSHKITFVILIKKKGEAGMGMGMDGGEIAYELQGFRYPNFDGGLLRNKVCRKIYCKKELGLKTEVFYCAVNANMPS